MSPEFRTFTAAEAVREESERRRGDDERRWLFGEQKPVRPPWWLELIVVIGAVELFAALIVLLAWVAMGQ